MAASSRLSLISPLRVWLAFNALFILLALSAWHSQYRLAAAENQRLVESQALTLTKARLEDLRARRFRDFVEGIGREFSDLSVAVEVPGETFRFGVPPRRGHCGEVTDALGGLDGSARVTMCRPFRFPVAPVLAVLAAYVLLSGLSLAFVGRLERRTTEALAGFLRESGVDVAAGRGLIGIMADMRDIRAALDRAKEQERAFIDARARAEVAEQVAHDIRSPLAAMEIAAASLPESERPLLSAAAARVREIAADLLARRPAGEPASAASLAPLVEAAVAEKRLELRARAGLRLEAELGPGGREARALIQGKEFQRLVSNLLNNAVEALEGGRGLVRARLSARPGWCVLEVSDDGRGIPPEVLARLGARGETHGKPGGSGLGLHHAFSCARAWGGRLELASPPGGGATATLTVPAVAAAATAATAVLVDDDALVRGTWTAAAARRGVPLRVYATAEAFLSEAAGLDRATAVYVDSELGEGMSGAELSKRARELGFGEVYLATGREPGDFAGLAHLSGVIGKTPPWA